MSKIILVIALLVGFGLVGQSVKAQNSGSGQGGVRQASAVASPTGYQVQNQNQVNTQNAGEESQLQVNTQEEENLGEEEGIKQGSQRSETAKQHMSVVALKVQELLQIRTTGGIGEQVRVIAQEQQQAQNQIQEEIENVETKGQLAKFFFGSDRQALANLKNELAQNQLRIKALEEIKNQLANEGDEMTLQETIEALVQQNTSLQEMVDEEGEIQGIFGWLFKLFGR